MSRRDPVARRAYMKVWRERRRADLRAYGKRWRDKNKAALTKYRRAWHRAHPGWQRTYDLARKYGLGLGEWDVWWKKQGERCGICGTKEARFNFDHHHGFPPRDPRAHRGILCHHCNLLIGNAKDDVKILRRAIAYLQRHERSHANATARVSVVHRSVPTISHYRARLADQRKGKH